MSLEQKVSKLRKGRLAILLLFFGPLLFSFQNCSKMTAAQLQPTQQQGTNPTPSPIPSPSPTPTPSPSPAPGTFSWKTLNIGAGGFIRGLHVAPDGTMVGRTDTYGAYLWNGSRWVQLVTTQSMPGAFINSNINTELTGQGVYEIQIAPSNTQIFYMAYAGFVFKSSNRGASWTQTSAQYVQEPNDGYAQEAQKMAVDPKNANIVYAGSSQSGLFVTKDGASTWTTVSGVPAAKPDSGGGFPGMTGILFDPLASAGVVNNVTQTIYVYSYGNGVYRSVNGGTSWQLLSGGPSNVAAAALSPNGNIYYATDGTNFWKYANSAWTEVTANTMGFSGQGLQAIVVNPASANEIIAISPGGTMNFSLDNGATWTGSDWSSNNVASTDIPWLAKANVADPGGFSYIDIGGVTFNPLVANQLILSAGTGVWTAQLPAATSINATTVVTYVDKSLGIEQLVANFILVPPGGRPVVASWDRPFFYIADPTQFPATYGPKNSVQIDAGWGIDYASSTPSFLVGLSANGQGNYSSDGGQTWLQFATNPSFPGQANGGSIAASTPQNIVLAPANGVQPYYTLDGGQSWHAITLPGVTDWSGFEGPSYLDERSVVADRVNANTFYLYFNGLYKTTNGGASWTSAFSSPITPFSWYNNELMSVPGEAGHLFFTGGWQGTGGPPQPAQEQFMRSTNGGTSWTAIPNILNVSCFGFGKAATGQNYPAIFIVGWVNNVYGVWQSDDNAQTWKNLGTYPNNSLDTIKTIAGDPNTYGVVYVGFGGSGYAYYAP
jgi:hypothetical protein